MRFGLSLVVMTTLFGAQDAAAYVLQQTETGAEVHWPHTCVTWWMESLGCPDVTPDVTMETLKASFETWDTLEGVYVDFAGAGVSCVDTVGLDIGRAHNVVMWRSGVDAWPHTQRVVGLTTLTLDIDTGEIVDADMEFNSEDFTFATDGDGNAYDLQYAVTHEIGHILGLDHSAVPSSVMYETADPGAVNKRKLAPDDIEGVMLNHGWANAPSTIQPCGTTAPQGTVEAPYCPPPPSSGCAGGGSHIPVTSLLLLATLWGVGRSRRRDLLLLAMSVGTATWLLPSPAAAQTCNPYTTPGGDPIYWPVTDVELSVDPVLPASLTPEEMLDALQESLQAWTELECTAPKVTIRDEQDGFAPCPGEGIDDGVQCIYWSLPGDEWPYGSVLIAVTLVHHNTLTAEIVDTDMAINGTGTFTWSNPVACDTEATTHDLPATLTHEFGHFFGLDHSGYAQSVMEGATRPGDCDKRTLHDIDIECICDTLAGVPGPPEPTPDVMGGDTADTSSTDVGTDTADITPPAPRGGCSGGQAGGSAPTLLWLSLLSLAHLTTRRRRPGSRAARAR